MLNLNRKTRINFIPIEFLSADECNELSETEKLKECFFDEKYYYSLASQPKTNEIDSHYDKKVVNLLFQGIDLNSKMEDL